MAHDWQTEHPPILRTWKRLYTAVIIYIFVLIALFYAFTRAYRFPS
jgi:hypothetical protein